MHYMAIIIPVQIQIKQMNFPLMKTWEQMRWENLQRA